MKITIIVNIYIITYFRKILEGKGKISHEETIKKAEKEYQIYREREMKELQNDFDLLMKSLPEKGVGLGWMKIKLI